MPGSGCPPLPQSGAFDGRAARLRQEQLDLSDCVQGDPSPASSPPRRSAASMVSPGGRLQHPLRDAHAVGRASEAAHSQLPRPERARRALARLRHLGRPRLNIDSLVVCGTEVEDLSRMTIVLTGQDGVVEQARRQLEDLVPVWAVLDYTNAPLVQRELLLAKINILGPEYFEELLAHHREMAADGPEPETGQDVSDVSLADAAKDFHPSRLVASEALRHKHEHLKNITYFAHQFGGKVLDISTNSCIVEVSAKPTRIDSFLKLVAPFGILESARTGLMALPRSPLYGPDEDSPLKDADEVVDASQLPPG